MRIDYVSKLEKYNINYWNEASIVWDESCGIEEDYWTDTGKIAFSSELEQKLIDATHTIHAMMLQAVDTVVNDENLLNLFQIPHALWKPVKDSWK